MALVWFFVLALVLALALALVLVLVLAFQVALGARQVFMRLLL